jgi:putative ABC transport system permease protein
VRDAMRPVALGIVGGVAAALALTRVLGSMLFGVSATDVATYAIACGALALSALAASIVPARRALAVDPIAAVRGQ